MSLDFVITFIEKCVDPGVGCSHKKKEKMGGLKGGTSCEKRTREGGKTQFAEVSS